MNGSNNPPEVVVELTREQAQFIITNCDSNIGFALSAIEGIKEESNVRRMVDLIEQFKAVKKAVSKGLGA